MDNELRIQLLCSEYLSKVTDGMSKLMRRLEFGQLWQELVPQHFPEWRQSSNNGGYFRTEQNELILFKTVKKSTSQLQLKNPRGLYDNKILTIRNGRINYLNIDVLVVVIRGDINEARILSRAQVNETVYFKNNKIYLNLRNAVGAKVLNI